MITPIANSEVPSRRSPRTIVRRRNGQLFKVKISENLLKDYETSKGRIFSLTTHNLSQSILVRRSLAMYLSYVSRMTDEQVAQEAQNLLAHR